MKALFFLRHYNDNDIDHITPIITRWVGEGHDAEVILIGFSDFAVDYPIGHLRRLPRMRVAHIREILPQLVMFLRRRNFTTFWEEVRLLIRMLAAFPGVELMLKPHTRGGWLQFITHAGNRVALPG